MDTQNIGIIIKKERILQQFTQKELAKDICSTSYLSKIESGKQIPQDHVKQALLDRLQINLNNYIKVNEEQFMQESYKAIENAMMTNDSSHIKQIISHYKLMNIESNLINELGENHINNHLNVSDKTRKKFIKNSKNKPNN